jgi:hypothetical protein
MNSFFTISVRGPTWLIHTQREESLDYLEVGCDGTNTYYLHSFSGSLEKCRQRGEAVGVNDSAGSIEPDYMPFHEAEAQLAVIWFAYASSFSSYYAQEGELRPVFYARPTLAFHRTRLTTRAYGERFSDNLRLPAVIQFLSDGRERAYQRGDEHGRTHLTVRELPAPFDAGFTNGTFRAVGTTNLGGAHIPTVAHFTYYAPDLSSGGMAVYPRCSVTLEATNVTSTLIYQSCLPALTKNSFINIQRPIRTSGGTIPVGAYFEHGKWPSIKETDLPDFR